MTVPQINTNTTTNVTITWTLINSPTNLESGGTGSLGKYLVEYTVVGSGTWTNISWSNSKTSFSDALPSLTFDYNT
jgi:hypothetical protein